MEKPTYNKKAFLVPDSPRSMSSYHAKIEIDVMKVTIHDCRHAIQLHNNLTTRIEIVEAIEKLEALSNGLIELKEFIQQNYLFP